MLDPEHDQVVSLPFERRLGGGDCLVLRSHAGRDDERSRRSAVDTEQNARWNPAFEITGASVQPVPLYVVDHVPRHQVTHGVMLAELFTNERCGDREGRRGYESTRLARRV